MCITGSIFGRSHIIVVMKAAIWAVFLCGLCSLYVDALTPVFVRHGTAMLAGRTNPVASPASHPQVNRRYKDSLWRTCLNVCVEVCSNWVGYEYHLKHCAENCGKHEMKVFNPEEYCFEFNRKRR